MGVPQLKYLLEQYSVHREWNKEKDAEKNSTKALYIDFAGIAYGVLYKYISDKVNQEEKLDEKFNIDTVLDQLPIEDIANDIFQLKVVKWLPSFPDFNFLHLIKSIFIANDHETPLAKIKTQEKRRQRTIIVPKHIRDLVADQFHLRVLKFKTDFKLDTDIVYDKTTTIGEGEWKCIRQIWKDDHINEYYILANDYDVIVGAFCLPDKNVNVIWQAQKEYLTFRSKIITWSTTYMLEKLLIVGFLNIYGNDYVPGIITTTAKIDFIKENIQNFRETMYKHNQEELYINLEKISKYIFETNSCNNLENTEWIITITFLIIYIYCFLLNMVFHHNKNYKIEDFFKKWDEFILTKNEIIAEENPQREYVVTMFLWYLCYCTNSFKRTEIPNDKNFIFPALPMQTPFRYNDARTKFNIELENKRSLFNYNNVACIKNVYNIINKLFLKYKGISIRKFTTI